MIFYYKPEASKTAPLYILIELDLGVLHELKPIAAKRERNWRKEGGVLRGKMNKNWRTLRSLRQAGPCSLVATYRAGAIARLVHKESPLARNEADLAHLNIKKSSEGAEPQEPLVSGSRAVLAAQIVGVGAQIAEVAGSIKSVQGQIVEVAEKVESTRFALDQADLLPDKREILMLPSGA